MAEVWYALHLRQRFEKCVQAHLEAKGYQVFLPTSASAHRWSDRIKTISSPLFPSYLFCRFDAASKFPILITPGVKNPCARSGAAGSRLGLNDSRAENHAIRLPLKTDRQAVGHTVAVRKGGRACTDNRGATAVVLTLDNPLDPHRHCEGVVHRSYCT